MNTLEIAILNSTTGQQEKLLIKRVKRNNLTKLIELQRILLEDFIYFNAEIGSLIANNSSWKTIEKICSIIPVLPNKYLSDYLDLLEDDLDTITLLFFTESWDTENFKYTDGFSFKPSLLSKLNRLDYAGDLGKGVLKVGKKKEKEEEMILQSLENLKEPLVV